MRLPTTIYTREMELRIRRAARAVLPERDLETIYEHERWHVRDCATGEIWAAVDAQTGTDGFDFESL